MEHLQIFPWPKRGEAVLLFTLCQLNKPAYTTPYQGWWVAVSVLKINLVATHTIISIRTIVKISIEKHSAKGSISDTSWLTRIIIQPLNNKMTVRDQRVVQAGVGSVHI